MASRIFLVGTVLWRRGVRGRHVVAVGQRLTARSRSCFEAVRYIPDALRGVAETGLTAPSV